MQRLYIKQKGLYSLGLFHLSLLPVADMLTGQVSYRSRLRENKQIHLNLFQIDV